MRAERALRRARPVVAHEDGTVSCDRLPGPADEDSGISIEYRRSAPQEISRRDFLAMRARDRARMARLHPVLRGLTEERTLVRVRIEFVMAIPLGDPLPSPQVEAIESAALAISGPAQLMPGSRISVGFAR